MASRSCVRCGQVLEAGSVSSVCQDCGAIGADSGDELTAAISRNQRMEQSAGPEQPGDAGWSAKIPQQAGRYRILGEVAHGGMGAVLKAYDPDLDRTLAVKMMLRNDPQRPDLAARFLQEAKVNGGLQHPGVPPVHEIGQLDDGRLFFAMKLIDGQTLSEVLRNQPAKNPDLPRLLDVFHQVCQTVAYAHDRGVIHRDLKPLNIMVGAFGEVQVMDWGLAKSQGGPAVPLPSPPSTQRPSPWTSEATQQTTRAWYGEDTDSSPQTQAGSVLGTPAYMSPEQASGRIDQADKRTDVFGLGAILCELITGQPPYVGPDGRSVLERARQGRLEECHQRLSVSGADRELLDLTRRCLAPEPDDRPADASRVAEEVGQYLHGVQERLQAAEMAKVEAQTRSQEERRRRKLQLGLATAVLGLVLLGGGGTFWLVMHRMVRSSALAESVAQIETLHARAVRSTDVAGWREAVVAAEQAVDAHRDLAGSVKLQQLVELQDAARVGLNNAERDHQLLNDLVDIRADALADAEDVLVEDRYQRAFAAAGIDVDHDPLASIERRLDGRPPQVVLSVVAALDHWAGMRGQSSAGAARLTAIAQAVDLDPWRRELRDLLARPEEQERGEAIASLAAAADLDELPAASIDLLGMKLLDLRYFHEAERVLREGYRRFPENVWLALHLATVLDSQRRFDEAIPFYTAARALEPKTAHGFAHALEKIGRQEEALQVLRDVARLRKRNLTDLRCLGALLVKMGHGEESRRVLQQAEEGIRQRISTRGDDERAFSELADVLSEQGKIQEATNAYETAARLKGDFLTLVNFGVHLRENGQFERAVEVYRQAISVDPGTNVRQSANARSFLGAALEDIGEVEQAAECYMQAVEIDRHDERSYRWLGRALLNLGRTEEAMDAYHQAIEIDTNNELGHRFLGDALLQLQKYSEAAEAYQRAIELNPRNPIVGQFHLNLGIARYSQTFRELGSANTAGDERLAIRETFALAVQAFQDAIRYSPTPEAYVWLGRALHADDRPDEAVEAYDRSIELQPENAYAYFCRGNSLGKLGQSSAAVESFDVSIQQRFPAERRAGELAALGQRLLRFADTPESVKICFGLFRKAVELQPADTSLPGVLSQAMYRKGSELTGDGHGNVAMDVFELALQLDPGNAGALCHLGKLRMRQGRFSEALEYLSEGHQLGSQMENWKVPSEQWLEETQRLIELEKNLPDVLVGKIVPADAEQWAEYAKACYWKRKYLSASQLFADAAAGRSQLASPSLDTCYFAARASALAATGQGDAAHLDEPARARLREQALTWLRTNWDELTTQLVSEDGATPATVLEELRSWQEDPDLAGIRDASHLAVLPNDERRRFERFWIGIDSMITSIEARSD